jgi:hypothetical protein
VHAPEISPLGLKVPWLIQTLQKTKTKVTLEQCVCGRSSLSGRAPLGCMKLKPRAAVQTSFPNTITRSRSATRSFPLQGI